MAAIGQKVADYVANQRQKDLLSCLAGVFGSLGSTSSSAAFFPLTIDGESGDSPTMLSPRHIAEAKSLLGDQGEKLTAVCMHSSVFYSLVERRAIDYVTNTEARLDTSATGASTINAFGGSIARAYEDANTFATYMGLGDCLWRVQTGFW